LKLVLTSALFGAFFLMSGCATQCESVCAQYDNCSIETQRSTRVDCPNFCGIVDAFNQRVAAAGITGCDQKWTAHLTCWQQNISKICDSTDTVCDASATDWQTCVTAYCDGLTADQFDPECVGWQGTDAFGLLSIPSPFQSGF